MAENEVVIENGRVIFQTDGVVETFDASSIKKLERMMEYEASVLRRTNTISNENQDIPNDPRNIEDSVINSFINSSNNDDDVLGQLITKKLSRRENAIETSSQPALEIAKLKTIYNLLIEKKYE
jgi:hypothetical protein